MRVAHRVQPADDRRGLDVVERELRGVRHLRDERLAPDERRVRRRVRPRVRRRAWGVQERPAERREHVGGLLDPPAGPR